jgi:alpha-tubulin suppressor-like RCC1 family protein
LSVPRIECRGHSSTAAFVARQPLAIACALLLLPIASAAADTLAQCDFAIERQGPSRITTEATCGRFTGIAAGYLKTVATRSDGSSATWGASAVPGASAVDRLLIPEHQALVSRREVFGPYVLTYLADGRAYLPDYPGFTTALRTNVRDCAVSIDSGSMSIRHRVIVGVTGEVRCDGLNLFGMCDVPVGLMNVIEVGATSTSSCALTAAGRLVCWGQNVGFPANEDSVVQLESAWTHGLARRRDGSVLAWGLGVGSTNAEIPATLGPVVRIAAGALHNAALLPSGSVQCWGDNTDGQSDVPPGLSDVIAIACGFRHTVALQADGSVVTWGGSDGFLRALPRRSAAPTWFAGNGSAGWLCLREDGLVEGGASLSPPSNLGLVRQVASDGSFAVACLSDGTLACWGANDVGQCNVPVGIGHVDSVDVGWGFAGALAVDGGVSVWGRNSHQQSSPPSTAVPARQLDLGARHAGVVRPDGSVVCWGDNSAGQSGAVTSQDAVEIRCGREFTLIRRATGGVAVFGNQAYRPPQAFTDFVQVAASVSLWLGLRAGGQVVVVTGGAADQWGEGYAGGVSGVVSVSGDMLGTTVVRRAPAPPCFADVTRDGVVDGRDLAFVLSHWGEGSQSPVADIDHDGAVDARDLSSLLCAWGPCG